MYWPTSWFLNSPELSEAQKDELRSIGKPGTVLSPLTMQLCYQIAAKTPSAGCSLTLLTHEDSPNRRTYLTMPAPREWDALERSGFVAADGIFGFNMDALH